MLLYYKIATVVLIIRKTSLLINQQIYENISSK